MSFFVFEAAVLGLKEGLKLGVVWLVFGSLRFTVDRRGFLLPFYAGLMATSLLFAVSFLIPPDPYTRDQLLKLTGYTFFVFFVLSAAALYQSMQTRLFGHASLGNGPLLWFLVMLSTVFYFSPDIIGASMYVRDLSLMKERVAATYVSAGLAFALTVAAAVLLPPKGFKRRVSGFFGAAQFFLFLSIVKLLGGGTKGFAELSLIPSIQRGVMKFVHDFVHQMFVFLLVPDHPLLKITTWNFIGLLFGPNISSYAVLVLLLVVPAIFLLQSFTAPLPEPEIAYGMAGPEKRKYKAAVRADRRKKTVPVLVFALVILVLWGSSRSERLSTLYNPEPRPLVADSGMLVIPLRDPTMDLTNGRIHKFSFVSGDTKIRLLILRKPDGEMSVSLDACEICPPEGYGQSEGHIVCLYCRTPIPLETIGSPGGCNPIPLEAEIGDVYIKIQVFEILDKWDRLVLGNQVGPTQ